MQRRMQRRILEKGGVALVALVGTGGLGGLGGLGGGLGRKGGKGRRCDWLGMVNGVPSWRP